MKRHKSCTVLNIMGLTIGYSCFILIGLFIKYELSYDRYHENAMNIYRVVTEIAYTNAPTGENVWNCTPMPLKSAIEGDFPEVLSAARIEGYSGVCRFNDQIHFEENMFLADQEFLEIFTFPLLKGDPETALRDPSSVVLSRETAMKYFGRDDALGKIMQINDQDFRVTGILEDIPKNSHFTFDVLIPYVSILSTSFGKYHWDNWESIHGPTYVLLRKGVNPHEFESKLRDSFIKHAGEDTKYSPRLEPLTRIHLDGNLKGELENNGDRQYVTIFSLTALFILLIACFNYINLTTARSEKRAKEVGIRKVVGAGRRHLTLQFLIESICFSFIAFALSIPCVWILLPGLNSMVGRTIDFHLFWNIGNLSSLIGIVIFAGLVSGGYPALYLSSLRPSRVIRGVWSQQGKTRSPLRNVLVVSQFVMSVALIICTIVVTRQLSFVQNRDLGFNQEHIVGVKIRDLELRNNLDSFKNALLKNVSIVDACYQHRLPNEVRHVGEFYFEGRTEDDQIKTYITFVDYDYLSFYDMKLIDGRDFSRQMKTDLDHAAIVNNRAVKDLGFEEPIGRQVEVWGRQYTIIGVVEDFHFLPLHQPVAPLTIGLSKPSFISQLGFRYGYLTVKIASENLPHILSWIENEFKKFSPNYAFEYAFLDDRIERMYSEDRQAGRSFSYFSTIAIMIACFGLYGLITFTVEQRTKEMGIRKVLGASIPSLFLRVIQDVIKWVAASNIIAWPLAYFVMNGWLHHFAYRVSLHLWTFLASAILVLGIALLTVSYRAIKAALASPVDNLRYE